MPRMRTGRSGFEALNQVRREARQQSGRCEQQGMPHIIDSSIASAEPISVMRIET
jgi:hypothetical protein